MPLGNGDIGLNVWTESNGDIVFYIGKTDAWSELPARDKGLMKLGRVRISLSPTPQTSQGFQQQLRLEEGQILVKEGSSSLRIWVDANHPVIHVSQNSSSPVVMKAKLELWRTEPMDTSVPYTADVMEPAGTDRLVWYHHDGPKSDLHTKDWTFGGVMRGQGFQATGNTLTSPSASKHELAIYPLAMSAPDPALWVHSAEAQAEQLAALNQRSAWIQHVAWWSAFWSRSWIYVTGDDSAKAITQGYILQRFVSAAAGRGGNAIKFNGSIFVVDNPLVSVGRDAQNKDIMAPANADFRSWGGQYWFQNTRPIYWPMLAQGDFEEMLPLFHQVLGMVPGNSALIQKYYKHDGFYFAETAPFFGGIRSLPVDANGKNTDFYFTPVLELSMMMLDYYDYTGDRAFVRDTLLPIADGGITFFDRHWKRDDQGKLLLDPDNAIEMFWKVHDPAPDIAGLRAVLPRLIALPVDLTTPQQRGNWTRLLSELPPLPVGTRQGYTVLLPYTGEQTQPTHNSENPELYAIYPFRLYGLEKPDLRLALDTFNARVIKATGCWVQDPVQAAYLGLSDLARKDVVFNLTRKDERLKFPAFWDKGHDYLPDEDNGGNGELALERMLLQADGRRILLLPAWPAGWNADFKLHAPFQTVIQGSVRSGKLIGLEVSPSSRKANVTVFGVDGAVLEAPH